VGHYLTWYKEMILKNSKRRNFIKSSVITVLALLTVSNEVFAGTSVKKVVIVDGLE